jgi:hypothetical protein
MRLILLLLFPVLALAGPIDNMVSQCESVMERKVCRVALDRKDYPNGYVIVSGVGKINADSYLKIRNAGDQMCKVVREVCTASFDGDDCKAARALWRQK